MELINYTETLVDEAINNYLNRHKDIANKISDSELIQIKACALNRLTPYYITSQKGYTYTKLKGVNVQSQTDILKIVVISVEKIINNRHT